METIIEMRRLLPMHNTPPIPQLREVRAVMIGKQSIVTIATAFSLAVMLSGGAPAALAQQAGVPAASVAEQGADQNRSDGAGHEDHGHHSHHKSGMTRPEFEAYRLQKLREAAAYFGIATDGKDAAQLKQELQVAKEANKEKWEAFKAEHKAKHEKHLREMAEAHGIETEGKTAEQLKQALIERHGGMDMRKFLNK